MSKIKSDNFLFLESRLDVIERKIEHELRKIHLLQYQQMQGIRTRLNNLKNEIRRQNHG